MPLIDSIEIYRDVYIYIYVYIYIFIERERDSWYYMGCWLDTLITLWNMPLNLQGYDLNIFDLSPRKQFNIPMSCVVKTLGVEHLSSEKILMLIQSRRALRRLQP